MTRCRHHLHHHHRHHVLCALHLYWILFVVIFCKGKQKYKTSKQYPKKLFPPSVYLHCSSPPKPPSSSAGEDTYIIRCSKTTYGRSPIKPTVGRLTDLPWIARMTYRRFLLPLPKVYPEALNSSAAKHRVCTKERAYLPRAWMILHLVLLHKTKREGNQGKGKISKQLDRTAEVSISLRDDASSSHTQIFTPIILMR